MHRNRWISVLAATFVPFTMLPLARQGPAFLQDATRTSSYELVTTQQPPPPPAPPQQSVTADSSSAHKKAYSHANDFLITGTVFDNRGLSLKGAQLRIRRESEKKNRWETYTNFRGEFALRVPQGAEYNIQVEAKGFANQSRSVDAKQGTEEKVIFHMEPVKGDKQ